MDPEEEIKQQWCQTFHSNTKISNAFSHWKNDKFTGVIT